MRRQQRFNEQQWCDANIVTAVQLEKDKALYMPGEQVSFKADKELGSDVYIRYSYLGDVIEEVPASGKTWTWTPPQEDFRGYMVEIVSKGEDHESYMGSMAVDVSSDWKKFPRYGFLSHYGPMSEEAIKKVIHNLNRHHINGVQYQDWHYKHHKPLAGTPANPAETWKEIANRTNSKQTIDQYIAEGRERGMKSIFYNLCFGVLSDGASDGVQEEWYIFKDKFRNNKDYHGLPKPYFWSDIYLTDPGHSGWLNYMAQQNDDVYQVFDFDGFQIDQLGNRETVYDYNGNVVNLPEQYLKFIDAMKNEHPEKALIMNAVSEYGQEQIAQGDIDFFYNEVWGDTPKFTDLERIIHENNAFRNDLKTVFAAYMNYNVADGQATSIRRGFC
ncbi:glycoside hydrolase family 66 protein [Geofilum rubicundum]|uniref:Dextranase n=1 Tax=Geofilum rubicundum JCM 15548 TaxID=1236989 RepID=A0A0E9LWJ4_9BACT|nr:glycoside hydrolase family 66 protein [Geofilum rubicundum]GAO29678.1 dextranase precursor [Geofilum rubicundum JCM 15548]